MFRRKKREISSVKFLDDKYLLPANPVVDFEPGEVPGPEGLHPNNTWPTPSGITLDNATYLCEEPIWTLPIFPTCDEYTRTSRRAVIDSCILDILVCRIDYIRHLYRQLTMKTIVPQGVLMLYILACFGTSACITNYSSNVFLCSLLSSSSSRKLF